MSGSKGSTKSGENRQMVVERQENLFVQHVSSNEVDREKEEEVEGLLTGTDDGTLATDGDGREFRGPFGKKRANAGVGTLI